MSFKEELAAKAQKTIEDTALNVAIKVKGILEEKADKGEREYFVVINQKDLSIATSGTFLELLAELLDGVKIDVIERMTFSMFKTQYLRFSW